jgi:hypothetical protein
VPVSEVAAREAFQITAVRAERTVEAPHEHITRVRLDGDSTTDGLHRVAIVDDLIHAGCRRYYVEIGGRRADVMVAMCPHCTYRDYLTTSADPKASNRLLELERF